MLFFSSFSSNLASIWLRIKNKRRFKIYKCIFIGLLLILLYWLHHWMMPKYDLKDTKCSADIL